MRIFRLLPAGFSAVFFFVAILHQGDASVYADEPPPSSEDRVAWPPVTRDAQPWTRWWWMGSAVDEENLTRELTRYQQAGLGGVEITPIYGVRGWEREFTDFLSPRWMELMHHSVRTANGLGMGVDLANGTGWCFGGPNVPAADANAKVVVRVVEIGAGKNLADRYDSTETQALVAYPAAGGLPIEITSQIAVDGTVRWAAPASGAPWRIYAVSQKPSGVMVKRAAPGGAGPMLNLLYGGAMNRYLQRFSQAFEKAGNAAPKPGAVFHDSYEYRSEWAPDFFAQFEKRRGYRLQTELPSLLGPDLTDHVARVKSDYRETVSDLLVEEAIPDWTRWAHQHGFITREQAHGSPGNWLDIYAAADIPETEMFNQDRDILVSKFASSAAHVSGRNLVGAETGTWAAEHFTETLSDLKGVADDLFLSGVNRITFHGTAYSPDEAAWPGWCFYASTELNPHNALWHDLPALNAYITRTQSMLQLGNSDNDILLYWPIYDQWHDAHGLVQPLTIHGREWLHDHPIGKAAAWLDQQGYQFDYVSDRQLAEQASGSHGLPHRIIIVPRCEHLPIATLVALLDCAKRGAKIIFQDCLPKDVPGLTNLAQNRTALHSIEESLSPLEGFIPDKLRRLTLDRGELFVGDLSIAIGSAGARIEPMARVPGLRLVRRVSQNEKVYFVVNTGSARVDRWVALGCQASLPASPSLSRTGDEGLCHPAKTVAMMDPMTGQIGMGKLRQSEGGRPEIYLQLEAGKSVILRAFASDKPYDPPWNFHQAADHPVDLRGEWAVTFSQGGPTLPPPAHVTKLTSWTDFGGETARSFAGTARYALKFDFPEFLPDLLYTLDLGDVRQSARVKLNGRDLGTVFTKPFRVEVHDLKRRENLLEVEVTGTSANRIRDLDVRHVSWKIFYDANIVGTNYQPFDAATWAVADQGLLGPVTLRPQKLLQPE